MIITFLKDTILSKFPVLLFAFAFTVLLQPRSYITHPAFIIICLTFLAYLSIYVITPHDLQWHLITSLERLLHQLYPAFLLLSLMKIRVTKNNMT